MKQNILVTGAAGFIGSHLVERLLKEGFNVTGIDNFDPFYDKSIKQKNISEAIKNNNFKFIELDIRNYKGLFEKLNDQYDAIAHIAAKAGVRPSINDPIEYQEVNLYGTQNLLEFAKHKGIKQFVFTSSSSVYGINKNVPWKESDHVLLPISPYASSKVSAELLGHVYSIIHNIRFIGLRLFTVYGPRQRPDLAIHKFVKLALNDLPIPFYGDGTTSRDYTYVDDIVNGITKGLKYNASMYEIINLGNHHAITLSKLVDVIEKGINKKIILEKLQKQPGDVDNTYADIKLAKKILGWEPSVTLKEGINKFVDWFIHNK
jgi:UDP-glucuronate 4-epimerase